MCSEAPDDVHPRAASPRRVDLEQGEPVHRLEGSPVEPVNAKPLNREPLNPEPLNPQPDLDTLWVKLMAAVGKVSSFTRSYLVEAHPVSLSRGVF